MTTPYVAAIFCLSRGWIFTLGCSRVGLSVVAFAAVALFPAWWPFPLQSRCFSVVADLCIGTTGPDEHLRTGPGVATAATRLCPPNPDTANTFGYDVTIICTTSVQSLIYYAICSYAARLVSPLAGA